MGQRQAPWGGSPNGPGRHHTVLGWIWRGLVALFALVGFLATLFVAALIIIGIGAIGRPAELPDEIVLLIDLDGEVPEINRPGPLETGPDPATVRDIVDALRRGKSDPAVKGLVAQVGDGRFGLARAQEIRAAAGERSPRRESLSPNARLETVEMLMTEGAARRTAFTTGVTRRLPSS